MPQQQNPSAEEVDKRSIQHLQNSFIEAMKQAPPVPSSPRTTRQMAPMWALATCARSSVRSSAAHVPSPLTARQPGSISESNGLCCLIAAAVESLPHNYDDVTEPPPRRVQNTALKICLAVLLVSAVLSLPTNDYDENDAIVPEVKSSESLCVKPIFFLLHLSQFYSTQYS